MTNSPISILVVFPHGLGDFIMGTPAFRNLRRTYPSSRIDLAVNFFTITQGLAQAYPYFNNIYSIHNPWFSSTYKEGIEKVERQISLLREYVKYDSIRWVEHNYEKYPDLHCLQLTAKELDVELESDTRYEVFIDEKLEKYALEWLQKCDLKPKQYAFIQHKSSDLKKNISLRSLRRRIPANYHNKMVVVGRSFDISEYPIGFGMALLKHSGFVALVDSVFVHAANALNKDIDIHITNDSIIHWKQPKDIIIFNQVVRRMDGLASKIWNKLNKTTHLYYRYRSLLVILTTSRNRVRRIAEALLIKIRNENKQTHSPSCEQGIFLLGFTDKQYMHQFLTRVPYVAIFRKTGEKMHLIAIDRLSLKMERIRDVIIKESNCAPNAREIFDAVNKNSNEFFMKIATLNDYWLSDVNHLLAKNPYSGIKDEQ